jgi:hypothetical protein
MARKPEPLRKPSAAPSRCPGGCRGYKLDGDKLICRICRRVYGRVRDGKDREHIERMIRQHGYYDPSAMHQRRDGGVGA